MIHHVWLISSYLCILIKGKQVGLDYINTILLMCVILYIFGLKYSNFLNYMNDKYFQKLNSSK